MPELSDTQLLMPEMLLFPSGLSQIMESVTETQRQVAETFTFPMQQMHEAVVSMIKPILEAQRAIANSPFIKMVDEIQEANKQMVKLITLRSVFSYLRQADVVNGEVIERKEVVVLASNTTLVPHEATAALPVITQTKTKHCNTFENFHMAVTIEGRLYYEDHLLKYISTNSKHGQFLLYLLEAEENYITDEFSLSKLKPSDLEKGLGYIRDDLVKYLAKDGLSIKLYRNRKKGYKLLNIAPFSN